MRATPDTLFEAASLSKVVVAVAVHDLRRDGLINLDRPVADHVAFANDFRTRTITPRHLLSHSSGLPNWRDEAGESMTSAFTSGTKFRYSGEGFVSLGLLIEAVTGKTAAQIVETRVLKPAGISYSTYGWARGTEPLVAWAYDGAGALLADKGPAGFTAHRDAGPPTPVDRWTLAEWEGAAVLFGKPEMPIVMTPNMAAGLWTTAADFARLFAYAQAYPMLSKPTTFVRGLWTGVLDGEWNAMPNDVSRGTGRERWCR